MPYRFEIAAQGRAGCKAPECAKEKIKISKGEFRVGTWVDGGSFQSWSWRHWGCFTPKQLVNVKNDLTENSDEPDFSRLDGFDDLGDELQDKIRKAVEVGHVEDDEWKGDVECNRPGNVGMRIKGNKAKANEPKEAEQSSSSPGKKHGLTDSDNADEEPAKKKQTRAKKVVDNDDAIADAAIAEAEHKPVKKAGRPPKKAAEEKVAAAETNVKAGRKKPSRPPKKASGDESADADTETTEPKKRATSRKKATKDESAFADIEPKQEPAKRNNRANKVTTSKAVVADTESDEVEHTAEDRPIKKKTMTRSTRTKQDAKKGVSPVDKDVSSADNETAVAIKPKKGATRATRANKVVSPVDKDVSSADNETGPTNGETKKSVSRSKTANGANVKTASKATKDAKTSGSDTSKDENVDESTEKPKRTRSVNKTNGNSTIAEEKPKPTRNRKPAAIKPTEEPTDKVAGNPDAVKEKPKTRGRKPAAVKPTDEAVEQVTKEPSKASAEQSVEDTALKSGDVGEDASADIVDEPVGAAENPAEIATEEPLESSLKPVKGEYTDDDF